MDGITDQVVAQEVAAAMVNRSTPPEEFAAFYDLIASDQIFEGDQNYEALAKAFAHALKAART